jgi:two-component system sensor histidine kinase CpxA
VKPRTPLRWKFLITALVNLLVLGLLVLLFVRVQLRQEFESFLMTTAREKITAVSRQLVLDVTTTDPAQYDALLQRYSETYGVRFLLFKNDGQQIAGPSTRLPQEVAERMQRFGPGPPRDPLPDLPGASPRLSGGPPPFLITAGESEQYWIGVRVLMPDPKAGTSSRATVLLVSPSLWTNPFFFEIQPWVAILGVALAVSFLCWLPLARGVTRAITQMMGATAAIAEGRFDVQVKTGRQDELGSLGRSINQMAERLRSYVKGQKRFLGDIAHELRSPLGRMQLALSILEERARPQDKGHLRDLKEEVEFMSGLTTELLTFARAEMRPETVALVPLNLRQIVERAIEVETGELGINAEIDPTLQVLGDEGYLFRAISNVLRNAVRYAGDQGPIQVSAQREADHVALTVADCGPGVPDSAIERIFTPFFRLEAARDRKTGGTGLGLAIARSCVEACEGSVSCKNRQPHGLAVTFTLKSA